MATSMCFAPSLSSARITAGRKLVANTAVSIRGGMLTVRPLSKLHLVCALRPHDKQSGRSLQSASLTEVGMDAVSGRVAQFASELAAVKDVKERVALFLSYARGLPPFPDAAITASNRVMGCTAQVWVSAEVDKEGRVLLNADSDSELSKGLAAVLVQMLSGLSVDEVLQFDSSILSDIGLGTAELMPSRTTNVANLLETIKKRTRLLSSALPRFPSLCITADSITAQGPFAETQARYLQPKPQEVDALVELLQEKKIGIVAHFYMDPEVQGVLSAAAERWAHVKISDSLVMADGAVKMAEAGCEHIAVLGVDFMSENVRAILDEAGLNHIGVFRMDSRDIGCSLAEAAESELYEQYLSEANTVPSSLHVIYINTSLQTKAHGHALVPTITCTSSNVVQTILQAYAQVPDLTVWYGPDTYMGRNVAQLFSSLATLPDSEVQQLHPHHTAASIREILPRLRYFQDGTCIVHHIFGGEVCELVRLGYGDAYLTAHFEVPGEMFTLAMEAKTRGRGVVGSTQNILDFIAARVKDAIANPFPERLQFVLGTESGMITSIVRKVQGMLGEAGRQDIEVEVVFPVSPEAITTSQQQSQEGAPALLPGGLQVIPGAASGEGCSMEGGCASCPYMKMNSLAALLKVCRLIGTPGQTVGLAGYEPRQYEGTVNGKSIAQAGCEPILHMRDFQKSGKLSDDLVADIVTRNRV